MANDPVDRITGLRTAADVSKTETAETLKAYTLGTFTTLAEVRNTRLTGRIRIMAASRFFRLDTEDTSVDDDTEASPVVIDADGNHWVAIEGERYDLQFSFTGPIGASEMLNPAGAPLDAPLEFLAGLPGSFIYAIDTPPAAEFTLTFKTSVDKGATWTSAFTATIAAGEREAEVALAADFTLPAGGLLRPFAPVSADASLETIVGVIAARR